MAPKTRNAILVLLLLTVVFFWKILLSNQFSILTGFEGTNQAYSWLNYWTTSLTRGELPLWDPFSHSGRSFPDEMQTGAFYFPRLILLPFARHGMVSPFLYQIWFAFVHFLGALFLYATARELGRGRFASIVAGVCFSFAGFLNAVPEWPHMYEAAIWLPLVFLCQLRALRAPSSARAAVWAALGGTALGLAVLAGGLHVVMMEAAVVATAAAYVVALRWDGSVKAWSRPVLIAVMIAGVGLCAGAVQLLPSANYSAVAFRWLGDAPPQIASRAIPYAYLHDGLWAHSVLQLAIHSAFEGRLGSGETTVLYVGVFPLLAALIGVWKCWSNQWVRYLAGLAVAAFAYALGGQSLLHGFSYAVVPKLWLAREANRFVFIAQFAIALLAAYGLDVLLGAPRPLAEWITARRVALGVALACGLAIVIPGVYGQIGLHPWISLSLVLILASCGLFRYLINGRTGRAAQALILALVMFDLGAFNWTSPTKIEVDKKGDNALEKLRSLGGVASYLRSRPGLFRVHLFSDAAINLGDFYRVQSTRGAGVTMLEYYLEQANHDTLLNVGYLVRPASAGEPGELYRDEKWKVYAAPGALPRTWLVHRVEVEPNKQRLLERLNEPGFDARQTALASAPLKAQLESVTDTVTETTHVSAYAQNALTVKVRAEAAGLLMLSEIFHSGWEATVNGRPAQVYQVDGMLRGVAVARGDSTVELRYRPMSVTIGAALSLFAFLGTACAAWWMRRRDAAA